MIDGIFLDPTAAQFPEIAAHGGVRPVAGPLQPGMAKDILARGAQVEMRLTDRHPVRYTIMPLGSADPVMMAAAEHSMDDIAKVAHNLRIGYAAALSQEPLLSKVNSLADPRYTIFVASIHNMQGTAVEMGEDGDMQVIG